MSARFDAMPDAVAAGAQSVREPRAWKQWLLGLGKSWLSIAPGHLRIDSLVGVKQHIRVSVVPLAHLTASKIEHDLRSSHTCVKAAELQNKILKFPPGQLRLHRRSLE
jgi:hypothetical protein